MHFFQNADGIARIILALMLVASIGTWYLIAAKGLAGHRQQKNSDRFLATFWAAPDLESIAVHMREQGTTDPFSHLVHHGFTAVEQHNRSRANATPVMPGDHGDFLTRALKRSIDEDRRNLEFGLTFLATIASSAPFVGLFGTVWGIYHALIAIGISGQGTLDKVAGPVGEALIMTAIGLAVAIPAAIAYNAFARANRNTLYRLNAFAYDVHAFLATGIKTSPMRTDARATGERMIALARGAQQPSAA